MSSEEYPAGQCVLRAEGFTLRRSLTVQGCVDAIQPAVEAVMEVVRGEGCAAGSEFEIEIALCEALANAVKYGCREDPDKAVQVCVACDPEQGVLIVVRDPGEGFDLKALPDAVAAQNLFSTHGRGIFLINSLMDHAVYEDGGTILRMRKGPKPK